MEMTEQERRIAKALAKAMAPTVDANEVGKVLAFWRRWHDPQKVFTLVKRMPSSGLVRTGRTKDYYESMGHAFDQYMRNVRPEAFGLILGWAFRLMRYYQIEQSSLNHRSGVERRQR